MYYILLVLAIVFNTVPRWIHGMYIWEGRSMYYIGQALSFFLILIADRYYKKNTKAGKALLDITVWWAFSNLLDELFFDPVHCSWNEVFFAIFITIKETCGTIIQVYITQKWSNFKQFYKNL